MPSDEKFVSDKQREWYHATDQDFWDVDKTGWEEILGFNISKLDKELTIMNEITNTLQNVRKTLVGESNEKIANANQTELKFEYGSLVSKVDDIMKIVEKKKQEILNRPKKPTPPRIEQDDGKFEFWRRD